MKIVIKNVRSIWYEEYEEFVVRVVYAVEHKDFYRKDIGNLSDIMKKHTEVTFKEEAELDDLFMQKDKAMFTYKVVFKVKPFMMGDDD